MMRIKPSATPGHVLVDLDEAAVRLLEHGRADERMPQDRDYRLVKGLEERITTPLKISQVHWRSFGIND